MAKIVKMNELTGEFLLTLFDDAGFAPKADEDGDLYISSEGAEFPFWVTLARKERLLKVFTYIRMRSGVTLEEAFAFSNDANTNVIHPSFFIHQKDNGEICLWADCTLITEFGIDTRMIIATARRFAAAFRYALSRDENDHFFESATEKAIDSACDKQSASVH